MYQGAAAGGLAAVEELTALPDLPLAFGSFGIDRFWFFFRRKTQQKFLEVRPDESAPAPEHNGGLVKGFRLGAGYQPFEFNCPHPPRAIWELDQQSNI